LALVHTGETRLVVIVGSLIVLAANGVVRLDRIPHRRGVTARRRAPLLMNG
jgi:hypothetical protein